MNRNESLCLKRKIVAKINPISNVINEILKKFLTKFRKV